MEVKCVLQRNESRVRAFHPDLIQPSNAQFAGVVEEISTAPPVMAILDCAAYRAANPTNPVDTWANFLAAATMDSIAAHVVTTLAAPRHMLTEYTDNGNELYKYEVCAYGDNRRFVRPYNCTANSFISVAYGSRDNYGVENTLALVDQSPDLIIRKQERSAPTIKLDQVLPIVNGFAAFPQYDTDNDDPRLHVRNGATLLKGTRAPNHDVTLLDLHSVGDVTFVETLNSRGGTPAWTSDRRAFLTVDENVITFQLDDATLLPENATVIISLFGKLYFMEGNDGNPITIDRDALTVSITIDYIDIAVSQVALLRASCNYDRLTVHTDLNKFISAKSVAELEERLRKPECCSFLMIVNNPNLCISRTPSETMLTPSIIKFPPESDGLLVNKYTGRMFNHFTQKYNSATLVRTIAGDVDTLRDHIGDNHMGAVGTIARPPWFKGMQPLRSRSYDLIEIYSPIGADD